MVVTNTNDSGAGSLRNAIQQANSSPGTSISVVATGDINLLTPLPPIQANMSINGPGATNLTIDGGGANRVFMVLSGTVTVSNLTVNNALAQGGAGSSWAGGLSGNSGGGGGGLGAGGALFVNSGASVTLHNVPLTGNAAVGGSGGVLADPDFGSGGGGGGGLGGNGGAGGDNFATATGGGGGGGINAGGTNTGVGGDGGVNGSGGNGTSLAGGGGGGGTNGSGGSGADGAGNGAAGSVNSSGGGGGGGLSGGNASGLNGGNGGFGGGGGGGGLDVGTFQSGNGGNGGYGGGGAGGGGVPYLGAPGSGGNGGFGGGGGAGNTTLGASAGTGGQHGGNGGTSGGGGGAALGGAVFVVQGGTLIIDGTAVSGSSLTAGAGSGDGQNGQAAGSGLFLDGVDLTFQGSSNAVVGDAIAGTGGINQNGPGSTTLSGNNTYTGATHINGGALIVNGTIVSQTTVGSGASLGGTGTIQQNVTNQGLITPGNSIGTLHVNGNFTQSSSGGLQIEIDDQGNGDRIAVQGNATIQGGSVAVRSQPGNYAAGSRYTFLTAQSLSGQFASISDDLAFLDVMLGYDANSAYFTLFNSDAKYADVAQTHNQFAMGHYLDDVLPSAGADFAAVLGQLDTLSADQARNAYSQIDGAFHGSLSQVGVQNTTLILYQLNNRLATGLFSGGGDSLDQASGFNGASAPVVLLRCDDSPGGIRFVDRSESPRDSWMGWSIGYGLGGNAQSNGNVSGINYGMGGMLAGIGRYLDDSTLFGFYGGYVGTSVAARDQNQSSNINGGQFGSYLRGADGFNYYTVIGGFEFDSYRTRRGINFGGINTAATANYTGWQGFAYGERGMTFGGPLLALQPFGALQYVYLRQNSFNESGAGALNLDARGSDANSLRTFVGGRALLFPSSRFSPQLRAAWVHELLTPTSMVNAHFGAAGGAFAVQGLSLGRDWALVGGGVTWQLSGGWSLWGNYDAMVNTQQVFHVGSGGLQFVW